MRSGHGRSNRGFTIAEVLAAFAVVSVASAVALQLRISARNAARANAELRLAESVAQGLLERARLLSPQELAGSKSLGLPLPTVAARLADAKADVTVRTWGEHVGLRHIRVTFKWRSRVRGEREVVRQMLVSDNHVR